MLRIIRTDTAAASTLRLEGKLVGPWVETLRQACAAIAEADLRVDLADVSFADDAGFRLLQALRRQGVQLNPCSNFINELLSREESP